MQTKTPFLRARDGMIAGVCLGLARRLDMNVNGLRLILVLSLLFGLLGLWVYLVLMIALPKEDDLSRLNNEMMLGVCLRLADRMQADVTLVRVLALVLLLLSFGTVTLAYVLLHFLLNPVVGQREDYR